MSKNQKTYILLALVLTIWGILGFKVVKGLGGNEAPLEVVSTKPTILKKSIKKREPIPIAANYRDPFLGTGPKELVQKKKSTQQKNVKKLPKKSIVYSGSLAKSDGKKRMFFVSINGQQYIMEKNQKIDDVTVLWGNTTSIKVQYPGYTETIKRSQ